MSRRFIVKDATMRSKIVLIALSSGLAACTTAANQADRGLASVNVPVVTTADYVFDAAAPGGALAPGEASRLSGWFQGLGLGYAIPSISTGRTPALPEPKSRQLPAATE